jgi:hypothetical protein
LGEQKGRQDSERARSARSVVSRMLPGIESAFTYARGL